MNTSVVVASANYLFTGWSQQNGVLVLSSVAPLDITQRWVGVHHTCRERGMVQLCRSLYTVSLQPIKNFGPKHYQFFNYVSILSSIGILASM